MSRMPGTDESPAAASPVQTECSANSEKLGSVSLGACQAESLGDVSEGTTLQVGLLQGK